jgi:predicted ester cyclase
MDTITRQAEPVVAAEGTRQTLTAYLAALRSGGDYGRHLAADVTLTMMDTGEVTRGRAAVVGLIDYLHRVAFAATPEFASPVVEADRALLEAVFIATHVGEFAGIPATGRSVRLPYAVAYDLAEAQIVALRIYLSMDALVHRLRDA